MPKPYKYEYDIQIMKILNEKGRLGFRQIKKTLEDKVNKQLSFDTFNYHMKNLVAKNDIQPLNKNNTKKGEKLFYELSLHIKQEIRLGIFRINDNKTFSEVNAEQDILKYTYYTIFYIIALKPPPIEVDIEYQYKYGVSVEDLTKEFSSVLGYTYLKLTKKLIRRVLGVLEKEGLVQKQKVNNVKEYRYFVNLNFGQFISECITTFQHHIILRYNYLWKMLRAPKYRERPIMRMIWDEDYINEAILDFRKRRNLVKSSPKYKELSKGKKDLVDIFDNTIYDSYIRIKETYSNLFEKYPVISNQILRIYFPDFLIEEVQNIKNKFPNKKYPSPLTATFTNFINLGDSMYGDITNKH